MLESFIIVLLLLTIVGILIYYNPDRVKNFLESLLDQENKNETIEESFVNEELNNWISNESPFSSKQ